VTKNGLSFYSSVFYQATLEDSQLSSNELGMTTNFSSVARVARVTGEK
jgi:hypothetical protein